MEHVGADDQGLQRTSPDRHPNVRDDSADELLGGVAQLRHLDLELALGGHHALGPVAVAGAASLHCSLIADALQEGSDLFLDSFLQDQLRSQPTEAPDALAVGDALLQELGDFHLQSHARR